ncbi:MAG: radical SAM protein [Candidatus Omnitrophica bacterium]|nr:radical SAM protein [Candidatus Omnitrophota bacterium]
MKLISIQEAYQRKFKRQKAIKKLIYDASGHCAHIGKLSPGCYHCFVPDLSSRNFYSGNKCNLNCTYCNSDKNQGSNLTAKEHLATKASLFKQQALSNNFRPTAMSFSGGGEPLLYLDVISSYMKVLRDIERRSGHKPWYYLYTNGILADSKVLAQLKKIGFDEIRFHLGASNFSKVVYNNLKKAVHYLKVVTVETPAWQLHRKKLFAMLPLIEDIGVKHLNIGEIELNKYNYERISKIMPHGEIYQCYETHLYDGGLVYDIIEEVIRKKYSYSVLDCNCFVKSIQRSPAKRTRHEDVPGLCAKY